MIEYFHLSLRLGVTPRRLGLPIASLGGFRLCSFGLAPTREARFLAPKVRARFQFVVLAGIAVEKDDGLRVLCLRHGVSLSEILGSIEPAFWPHDAEASASSDASASCYSAPENVGVLPVVETKGKLIQVQRQVFAAHAVIGADDTALEQRPERIP